MKTKKPFRISEDMLKRYLKNGGGQSKGSPCIICGENFDDCAHSFAEVERVVDALVLAQLLGIPLNHPEPVAPAKRLVFFNDTIINVDDISHAVRTSATFGFAPGRDSVRVHFLSTPEPVLVYGVTMAEFTEAVKQARA